MTESDEKLLNDFELRMRQLMYVCDSLREENNLLRKELTEKDSKIDALSMQTKQLQMQYDNLKFAKSFLADDKSEILAAKNRLSKLVQDVDKCIALLKS